MLGYIKGIIEDIGVDHIILENNNIGFKIYVPGNYYGRVLKAGDEVKIYTYMSVREDDISLFGFVTKDELEIYKMLLGVSGVGPKGALSILSCLTADELRLAIMTDDAKAIAKSQGIGSKTAQKVIIELKDKFKDYEPVSSGNVTFDDIPDNNAAADATAALIALGYSSSEAVKAVRKAAADTENADAETLIKLSLKYLF